MKRIIIYLAFTFGVTYALEFGVIYPLALGGDPLNASSNAIVMGLMALVMFVPALGVVFTRLVTKEGFKNSLIKPKQFKKTFKYYLMGWFGPTILIAIGAVVYFVLFPADFDPQMTSFTTQYQELIAQQGVEVDTSSIQSMIYVQLLIGAALAPLINFIPCFGEEWGWRGYLLPKVNERLSFVPTILVTGVIWGLWHAPLTALGHNYGMDYAGWPVLGIFAMCCFCIAIGTFLSYITIKAKNCLPAVLAHAALNGVAAAAVYLTISGGNPFIGPMPTGVIGGIGFIATAVIICIKMRKDPGTWMKSPDGIPSPPNVENEKSLG